MGEREKTKFQYASTYVSQTEDEFVGFYIGHGETSRSGSTLINCFVPGT